ncbi:MAG: stage II sporulation protein D [Clostridia bacterium]|nr:stage II sporulation protein D [Clostridia bacterium]
MRNPKKRRRGPGIHPPLACAFLLLLAALLTLAWQRLSEPPGIDRQRIVLYDAGTQTLRTLTLGDYLTGVVAAEMPALYHEEALRAQAVAARTRAVASMRRLGGTGCAAHPGADICGDSAHCQAWMDDPALRRRWGADYAAHLRKITDAVQSTRGEVMTYGGEPIEVLYHAVSGGATENVEHVFSEALPYLRGVESPGEEGAARYQSEQRFAQQAAAEALNAAFPGAGLSAEGLPGALAVLGRFDSGRADRVRVGALTVPATAFRRALGLLSTNFTLAFEGEELVIRQRGYGHGVGMSQAGADALARAGWGYADILRHYYTGIELQVTSY